MATHLRTALFLLILAGVTTVARADTIPTLFGTGLSPAGAPLAPGAADPHYLLVVAPVGVPAPASPLVVGPVLPGGWAPNSLTSQWINPTGTGDFVAGGDYWYTTTFDLTGFVASTTTITGGWAADDAGMSVSLNGLPLAGITTGTGIGSYAGLHPFIISGAALPWLPGINTLTFKTSNTSAGPVFTGPTGLLVKITLADADVVPVPAAAWLFGSALLAMGGLRVRRARGG